MEKHRELFKSINSYSQEIVASVPGLSPLAVLKTAINLHQKSPNSSSSLSPRSPPLMQASPLDLCKSAEPKQYEEKLERLKTVLPTVPEVKLAALLTREKGNINAVAQCLLDKDDSGSESGDCRYVDSTLFHVP